jgi:putative pyruvate formate lyase activating enzyme
VSRKPSYQKAYDQGILGRRAQKARQLLKKCTLCPRRCGVDRTSGEIGVCNTGDQAWVSSHDAHFGEERPLVGQKGSGTIFFTHCNLLCNFCQNFDISHQGIGQPVSHRELADIMLRLQRSGCHNINLVTPSHVVPQILSALEIAVNEGLNIPLIYNSSGYDQVKTLKLLKGIVDIYMPDFKFWDPNVAEITCDATDYPEVARQAIQEMHAQVGDLKVDENGLALKGVLLRHLVLPDGLAGTREIMEFIARHVSPNTYVNIMPQYRPCGQAARMKALARPIRRLEYEKALQEAADMGIYRLDEQKRVFAVY